MKQIKHKKDEHIFLIYEPISNKTKSAACTCGYRTGDYDVEKFDKRCPDCNSKAHSEMLYQIRTIDDIYGYEFTTEKAIVNYRKIIIDYEEDIRNDQVQIYLTESKVDYIIEYETNKNGKKVFKPKKIKTEQGQTCGQVYKLLKNEIEYAYISLTDNEFYKDLKAMLLTYRSTLSDIIWQIHNKYKYCYDAIQKGFILGNEVSIDSLKNWNQFIKNLSDKELEYVKKLYEIETATCNTQYYYIIRDIESIKKNYKTADKISGYIDTKLYIHKNSNRLNTIIHTCNLSTYYNELTNLIYCYDFTLEEIEELFMHAERQAYDLLVNLRYLLKGYEIYKSINIGIDKKPKELAIYIAKCKKIASIIVNQSEKKFYIDDNKKTYEYYLTNSLDIVKTVYENFGFKGLDTLLSNHYVNKRLAYTVCDNNTKKPFCIAFTTCNDGIHFTSYILTELGKEYLPDKILTFNGEIIEDKEKIKEYLIKIRTIKSNKGE